MAVSCLFSWETQMTAKMEETIDKDYCKIVIEFTRVCRKNPEKNVIE